MDEGYIKFNCNFEVRACLTDSDVSELIIWRDKLYAAKLIGAYDDGIGFGNISIREPSKNTFIISGSATGNLEKIDKTHFARVKSFDIKKNSVTCEGLTKASSESLTHAAFYTLSTKIKAVVHVHNKNLWTKYINVYPTTSKNVPYGTPEMAEEIKRLFFSDDLENSKLIVMAGHAEGLISFGESLEEAAEVFLK